jgi:gliding motility-associated-like protein
LLFVYLKENGKGMKKNIILVLIFSFNNIFVQGQNCGFEDGSFSNWRISNGSVSNNGIEVLYKSEVVGTVENEHIITQKNGGNDPKITNESIPMVAPGNDYSVRFGNITHGGKFDRLSKTFTIDQENTLFQYKFAVILQNDIKHTSLQKPGFNVRIFDRNGNNITCSYYDIQLVVGATATGFKTQGDIEYRNWTTVAVDLRNYIGQTVTVEATVHGCTEMKHFGYAYFNASCSKSEIKPETGCTDLGGDLTLDAPDGFEKYAWSTSETTRTIKVKASLGTQFFVKLTPYNSLNENCNLQMNYTIKKNEVPLTVNKSICIGNNFSFRGKTYNTSGSYVETINNSAFCDSVITLNLNVIPIAQLTKDIKICEGESFLFKGTTYNSTGQYFKTISSSDACDSIFTINLKIVPIPRTTKNFSFCEGEKAKIGDSTYSKSGTYITNIKRTGLCDSVVTSTLNYENSFTLTVTPNAILEKGEKTEIKVNVQPSGTYVYDWTPKETLMCGTCSSTIAETPVTTKYTITVSNSGSRCSKKIQTQVIIISDIFVPTAFSPNGDSVNDIFYIVGSKSVRMIKEMLIYDRWGELIFRDTNFMTADSSHGWDGNYRGKSLNPDIFTYKIIAEMKDGEVNDFTGAFTLLR